MIKYQKDTDNIVTLRLDMEGRKVNIINHEIGDAFIPVIDHLKAEKAKGELRGIILTSDKKTFLAGGDLDYLYQSHSAKEVFDYSERLKRFFRDLEMPGVPVVAAMNGTALGSGFELAFACHYRIAIDTKNSYLGFPEVRLGLMPGSGGIIRLLWLFGIEKAYKILSKGKRYTPKEALLEGIINELATDEEDMIEKARNWLLNTPTGIQPWDIPDTPIPGGRPHELDTAKVIARLAAENFKRYRNLYPAQNIILETLVEGAKVDFDTACLIESRNFTKLILSQECKNMTKLFWYDFNSIRQGDSRPRGFGRFRPRKVGVIGAGRMGIGITFSCIMNGIDVILKDVNESVAKRGVKRVAELLDKEIKEQRMVKEEKEHLLRLIHPTEKFKDFDACDLVIEAVFENPRIKQKVAKDSGKHMDEYTFFGSNTALLSIEHLSSAFPYPENYIGLRFFAPADTCPLVEVVKAPGTSDETIARAFDFVKRIRKTPIVIKDNPGFYAARVENVYILEGIQLLLEGYPPAIIENACILSGMPKGALELADERSLKMVLKAERQAAEIYGSKYIIHPAVEVLQKMEEIERTGKFHGAGFYNYIDGEKDGFWEGLEELFPVTKQDTYLEYLEERLLFAQVLEAVWCLQEKIVSTVAEANIGSVYGWGFPACKGGVIQYVNQYGIEDFFKRAKEFENEHGPRFIVPKILREKGKIE